MLSQPRVQLRSRNDSPSHGLRNVAPRTMGVRAGYKSCMRLRNPLLTLYSYTVCGEVQLRHGERGTTLASSGRSTGCQERLGFTTPISTLSGTNQTGRVRNRVF